MNRYTLPIDNRGTSTVSAAIDYRDQNDAVVFRFDYDGGIGQGGTGTIEVDGTKTGSARVPRTTPYFFSISGTLDVGIDRTTPVSNEYEPGQANAFTGVIDFVRLDVETPGSDTTRETAAAALRTH